jgi:pimeloyl-ACP methyl ester carboxylesterase
METARKALGYRKIHLSGYSFGGAIAYAYCVRYPKTVRRALFTEAAFPFYVGMTKPAAIDDLLNSLNEEWKKNPDNVRRSPDIVQTISSVLQTLPKEWHGVTIDPDRIRFMTWGSLNYKAMTLQCFEAYVAAEQGDYTGLAQLNRYFDNIVDVFNWGEMLSKTFSTDTGEIKDFEAALSLEDSIIGSPLSLLGWGLRQHTNWPVKTLPEAHRRLRKIDTESLLVVGTREMMAHVQREYMPYFTHGHLVAHKDLGHMDLPSLQIEATQHMEKMFFLNGTVDISKFQEPVAR